MKRQFLFLFISMAAEVSQAAPVQGNQQRPEDARSAQQYQADCAAGIALSSCGAIPVSTDCTPDKHWVLTGSQIAHCVLNNMECPTGTTLEHDQLGNPSCQPIICPDGQSLVNGQCVAVPLPPAPPLGNTLPPLSFNGMSFGGYSYPGKSVAALNIPTDNRYAKLNLILNTTDGSWQISATSQYSPYGCCAPIQTSNSGIWASKPVAAYQYRISSMVYGPLNFYSVGRPYNIHDGWTYWNGITTYPAAPSNWIDLPARSLVSVAGINMDLYNGCSYVTTANVALDVRFTLQIRPVAQPTMISTTYLDLVFRTTGNTACSSEG